MQFIPFPKIARLSRDIVITEKIDGTNAQIYIEHVANLEDGHATIPPAIALLGDMAMFAGSRTQWIIPTNDNYGFAKWVAANAEDLFTLGPGSHFGEWWGQGIQRRYGMTEKVFSLFNTARWGDEATRPKCCRVVPTLYHGIFSEVSIQHALDGLALDGSKASPGFTDPEGIVIFHTASGHLYKKTIVGDEKPKGSKE